ncbi:nitroreductase family protein [Corynebacterium mendelii]|uniref:Nitroreductase family protein n=1 Tax=Corynebacterium mendelii TaxID=2765362 RepID=A0A939DXI8_9CORY|nr:nitroreductase family protein [Corynebacterium mendelii]MBN9643044.1 nitroreductase family protein [Corynebacterium mendelii]
MTSFHDLAATRRANRSFTGEPVDEKVLDRICATALEAPSAFNTQMRDLVVVRDETVKKALVAASGQQQFLDAPVVLVAVGFTGALPPDADELFPRAKQDFITGFYAQRNNPHTLREHALRGAMLLASFAMMAATEEGLATCPTTGWDEQGVKQAIGLGDRDDAVIALLVTVGHSDTVPPHPGRQANRRVDDSY